MSGTQGYRLTGEMNDKARDATDKLKGMSDDAERQFDTFRARLDDSNKELKGIESEARQAAINAAINEVIGQFEQGNSELKKLIELQKRIFVDTLDTLRETKLVEIGNNIDYVNGQLLGIRERVTVADHTLTESPLCLGSLRSSYSSLLLA